MMRLPRQAPTVCLALGLITQAAFAMLCKSEAGAVVNIGGMAAPT